MKWNFAANLTMLWPELDAYERFGAAAAHGFTRVELLFPQLLDSDQMAEELDTHQLALVLFDVWPGNWGGGERGLLGLPNREEEFRASVEQALSLAQLFGTKTVNVLAGVVPEGVSRAESFSVAVQNLRWAAREAKLNDVVLLIEPLNRADVPSYLAATTDEAAQLIEAVQSPAVGMQFDLYHAAMGGDEPIGAYLRHAHLVKHIQIADSPGRHEPGTGAQPIRSFLRELDRTGFSGSVGLEYVPSGTTEESLAWLESAWT